MKQVEYQGELLGEVSKRDGMTLRLYSREYKGHAFMEIREWITNPDYQGPSPKGITFPPSCLPELAFLLDSAIKEEGDKE